MRYAQVKNLGLKPLAILKIRIFQEKYTFEGTLKIVGG